MKSSLLSACLGAALLSSCTVVQVDPSSSFSGIQAEGLVSGYAAFGMSDESGLFKATILDGPNDGSVASVRIANLLGIDVGLLGAALTIGPLHLGLGTLFYCPYPPQFDSEDSDDEDHGEHIADMESQATN